MKRVMLGSKIHGATITKTDINYRGSISIDGLLMTSAGIEPYEQVHLWNLNTGKRIITYAIRGKYNSGNICVNGSAVHGNNEGDKIIISTFIELKEEEIELYVLSIIIIKDQENRKWKKEVI